MHSFLFIGKNRELLEKEINKFIKLKKLKPYEHPLKKISDVRELNSFVKLKTNIPTAMVCHNIDNASTEALNAFLKKV